MTRSTPRTAAALLAIFAIVGPWMLDLGSAVHVALEAHHGHEGDQHEVDHDGPSDAAGVHGHPHPYGTPAHDHGSSLPDPPAGRDVRVLAVSWSAGTVDVLSTDGTGWSLVDPSATPSPPTVSSTVLRI